ncbi:hypothetical protein KKA15_04030 [Patescibacteria group bacterium]|nr:hypothetical protein [Patescibacteria group bacterium]
MSHIKIEITEANDGSTIKELHDEISYKSGLALGGIEISKGHIQVFSGKDQSLEGLRKEIKTYLNCHKPLSKGTSKVRLVIVDDNGNEDERTISEITA